MKKSEIKIKPFKNPSGETVWRVSGIVNGKRRRQNFPKDKHAEAMTVKQNWERELLNMVPLPTVTTRLTADQAGEAEACYRRITGSQITSLTHAVEFALANYRPATKQSTVTAALELFVADKRAANKRDAYITKIEQKTRKLVAAHGPQFVHEVQTEQLRALIFRAGCGISTQDSDYRVFTTFFNWAVEKKYCAASPMDAIQKITVDVGEPQIFTVPEVRRLMLSAMQHKSGKLVPYLALGLMCAIRPKELARLTWDDIDLDAKTVNVSARIAKMRSRRLVEIPENALWFLMSHATEKKPFVGPNFWKDFYAVRALARITVFPPDVLRHTGISFHLAKHKNEGLTAEWAGNSPDMIHKHYKGIVKAKDVEAFYSITPETLAAPIAQLAA